MTSKERGPSRIVGILGGMGPAATVDFYDKLVSNTPVDKDQDHIRTVIWADPTVPNRQEALLDDGVDPTPWLAAGIARLVDSGAEVLVVPCNTVHAFLPGIVPPEVEFISMLEATVAAVGRRPATRSVGVLATDGALSSGLFQTVLDEAGYEIVLPGDRERAVLAGIVASVKTGGADPSSTARLSELVTALATRGAQTTILGCTELSVLNGRGRRGGDLDLIDPALELALATIDRAWSSTGPDQNLGMDPEITRRSGPVHRQRRAAILAKPTVRGGPA